MSDELTVRIAEVLAAHRIAGSTGGILAVCACGESHDDFATHQAEQVRAVLGETTTEWSVRFEGRGVIWDGPFRTREQAEAELAGADDKYLPGFLAHRTLFAASPWTEATS